ncbi:MAG TPA: hypothetical protein VFQ11_15350 [Nocardioidaceae bacterium]|nr:hypothetical protein [Nocardioidaceae bacterium]
MLTRALTAPGFAGVLGYSPREALWLCQHGISDDILMGYPTVDIDARGRVAPRSPAWRRRR